VASVKFTPQGGACSTSFIHWVEPGLPRLSFSTYPARFLPAINTNDPAVFRGVICSHMIPLKNPWLDLPLERFMRTVRSHPTGRFRSAQRRSWGLLRTLHSRHETSYSFKRKRPLF